MKIYLLVFNSLPPIGFFGERKSETYSILGEIFSTLFIFDKLLAMGKRALESAELENDQRGIRNKIVKKRNRRERRAGEQNEKPIVAERNHDSKNGGNISPKAKGLDKRSSYDDGNASQTTGPKDEHSSVQIAGEPVVRSTKSGRKKGQKRATETEHVPSIRSVSSHGNLFGAYSENTELASLPQSHIDNFLTDHFISVSDPIESMKPYRPIIEFSYLPLNASVEEAYFRTFKTPTPIQAVAWPFILAGRDVIGVAETGSGKTMAFAIPCVHHLTLLPKDVPYVKAVILSPTRELAIQTHEQIVKLTKSVSLKAVCIYGGIQKHEQRKSLKTADIIVATPGRLNDLINEGCADISKVSYVVLDEADRMLDKGFEDEIRRIIKNTLPLGKRQTTMFTATWPESIRALASTFMVSPVKIVIGNNSTGDLRANTCIVQKIELVTPQSKEFRLLQLLKQYQSGVQKDDRILVFCLYKKEAARIEVFIRSKGIRAVAIHGDLNQEKRIQSLNAFKSGETPVLVATDVAARGIDIPDVKLVINCTFPLTIEDYVHRIGRTGRAGKDGLAITMFTEHDKAHSGA